MSTYLVTGEDLPKAGVEISAEEQGFTVLTGADWVEAILEAWASDDERRQWSRTEETFVIVQANALGKIINLDFWPEYENGEYDIRNSPFELTAVETRTAAITFDSRALEELYAVQYVDLDNLTPPYEIRVNGIPVYKYATAAPSSH